MWGFHIYWENAVSINFVLHGPLAERDQILWILFNCFASFQVHQFSRPPNFGLRFIPVLGSM